MSQLRKSAKGYTQVSNALLNDKNLSLKAKGLFAFMDSKPDGWTFTIKSMANQLKEGSEAVQSAANELKNTGYLRYHKQPDGHGIYELIDNPNPGFQDPNPEKPNQGFPKMGKPGCISNKEPIAKKIDRYNAHEVPASTVSTPQSDGKPSKPEQILKIFPDVEAEIAEKYINSRQSSGWRRGRTFITDWVPDFRNFLSAFRANQKPEENTGGLILC